MSERPTLWSQVRIEPALLPYAGLSPKQMQEFTSDAKRSGNPVARLEELLTDHATERRKVRLAEYEERKAKDAEKILAPDTWPANRLRLKTQPWITEKSGMRFAFIHRSDLLTVVKDSDLFGQQTFTTVEELVETWSVD